MLYTGEGWGGGGLREVPVYRGSIPERLQCFFVVVLFLFCLLFFIRSLNLGATHIETVKRCGLFSSGRYFYITYNKNNC